ncbi:MAG: hypothetical protein Q9215_005103, partial [Flavoplaca cf. flavocitrina]
MYKLIADKLWILELGVKVLDESFTFSSGRSLIANPTFEGFIYKMTSIFLDNLTCFTERFWFIYPLQIGQTKTYCADHGSVIEALSKCLMIRTRKARRRLSENKRGSGNQ